MKDYICPLDGEVWKPVKGYDGKYEVSNMGRIKSFSKKASKHGSLLKLYVHPSNGYAYVMLHHKGKSKHYRVHVLVMETFTDYKSRDGLVIDHINCIKTDNRLSNLEAVTPRVNAQRAVENQLVTFHGEEVLDLDTRILYESYSQAARAVGGKRGELVKRVCMGTRSHYRGHHFARLEDYYNGTIPLYTGKTVKKESESLWR